MIENISNRYLETASHVIRLQSHRQQHHQSENLWGSGTCPLPLNFKAEMLHNSSSAQSVNFKRSDPHRKTALARENSSVSHLFKWFKTTCLLPISGSLPRGRRCKTSGWMLGMFAAVNTDLSVNRVCKNNKSNSSPDP